MNVVRKCFAFYYIKKKKQNIAGQKRLIIINPLYQKRTILARDLNWIPKGLYLLAFCIYTLDVNSKRIIPTFVSYKYFFLIIDDTTINSQQILNAI